MHEITLQHSLYLLPNTVTLTLNNAIPRVDNFVLVSFDPYESILILIQYSNRVFMLGLVFRLCEMVKWVGWFA